ncbi:MAG TPA: hypothetical protein VGO07_03750 [Candidatus Saccharimonadales bacterium]|nr:hypothetical protein [Candidatus Saccharimonadales bacterium]
MTMFGTIFSPNTGPIYSVNGFYQRGGALPAKINTPIVVAPNPGQSRVAPPTPTPVPAVLAPHIITTTVAPTTVPPNPGGPNVLPPGPSSPVVSTPSGTADSGASGTAGSSPTTDSGRLLDMLGTLFKSQDVAQSMAPVSFAPTDTGTSATTTGGGSSGGIILVVVVLAVAAFWYFHTH